MVKHAILLADEEWCKAAASGKVKVYDFIKPRKRGIYAIGNGSVCVVMTKAKTGQPQIVYGEFTVKEVKEVDASEYNRLAEQGLIRKSQTLRPGERRWVIFFDEFKEYARKPRKAELTDVKTATSNKPISEWVISGLSYIDDQALEGIRKKAGEKSENGRPLYSIAERLERLEERVDRLEKLTGLSELNFPLSHECVELMLLKIGRQLGFEVYTADPSKTCSNVRLGEQATITRNDLSRYAGPEVLEPLSRIDVVWHRSGEVFYVFEVVVGGSMHEALLRLSRIGELNARLFVVSPDSKRKEYENRLRNPAFNTIRGKCKFLSTGSLARMFILTNLWRQSIESLQLPHIK